MSDGPDPIDTRLVRRLAGILNDTGLSEIEVERGDLKIRVAKTLTAAPVVQAVAPTPLAFAASAKEAAPASTVTTNESLPPGEVIKSPMVGTVYLSPEPGKPAFISVGKTVKEGDTLFIIEAMKTMNAIAAPRGGTVKEISVTDGTPVEFGQTLCVIA